MNTITEAPIGFALIEVNGRTPSEISERVTCVCDSLEDATIDTVISGMVIVSYGTMPFQKKHPEAEMSKFASEFIKIHGDGIRLVWGVYHGAYGNIGGSTRFHYGFIIPEFVEAFVGLSKLKFGEAIRI